MPDNGKRILVVDDHPQLASMFAMMMENTGYSVSTAADGHEALKIINGTPPALVFSDIRMPGMDGRELLIELKRSYRETKVLMMSGDNQDAEAYRILGAMDLIPKPLRFPVLMRKIDDIINGEKRSTVRINQRLEVIAGNGEKLVTTDISSDGMLLQGTLGLPPGSMAPFTIRSPFNAATILTHAAVVRELKTPQAGLTAVRFLNSIGPDLLPLLRGPYGMRL